MRTHDPSSRMPAVQTVSPYLRDRVGYVFTVMRMRSFITGHVRSEVEGGQPGAESALQRLGDAVPVALGRQPLVAGQRDAGAAVYPAAWLRSGLVQVSFLRPVRPGDTITSGVRLCEIEDAGGERLLRFEVSCVNQNGTVVLAGTAGLRLPA